MAKAKKTEKQDVVETPVQEEQVREEHVQEEQVREEQAVQETTTKEPEVPVPAPVVSSEPVVRQLSATRFEVEFANGKTVTFRREGGRYVKSSISSSTIEGLVSRLAKL